MKHSYNSPVSTASTPVPLIGRGGRHSRVAEISHPETKYPIDHSVNRIDPHENADAFRQAVRDLVADMAARGAFDQDTLEALNNTIASWMQTWISPVLATATRRREVAEQLYAQTLQNQTAVANELDQLHAKRVEITAVRDELLRQLGFADRMLQSDRPVVKRELPASRLRVLHTATASPEDGSDPGGSVVVPMPVPGIGLHPTLLPAAGFSASTDTASH